MRTTASEIRDEMRTERQGHAERMARRKAAETLGALVEALTTPTLVMQKLMYQPAEKFDRKSVDALVNEVDELVVEVDTLLTLFKELATMLPEDAGEQTAEKAA